MSSFLSPRGSVEKLEAGTAGVKGVYICDLFVKSHLGTFLTQL